MGIYDREYMSDGNKGAGIGGISIIAWLLIINIAAAIIQHLIFNNSINDVVNLSKDTLFSGQIWRLLTYQFCHGDWGHLLMNMVGLFFVGRMLQQVINQKLILPLYLFAGLAGGICHIIWGYITSSHPPVIGASASVLGIVMALTTLIPEQRVTLLFLPVQFKLKYFGWFIIAYNVIFLFFSLSPGFTGRTAYMAHLGGIAAGWFFIKIIYPNVKFSSSGKKKKSKAKRSKISEAAEEAIQQKRKKETIYLNKRVDTILEKINSQGMQSLTDEERKILERSSEKLSRKTDDES